MAEDTSVDLCIDIRTRTHTGVRTLSHTQTQTPTETETDSQKEGQGCRSGHAQPADAKLTDTLGKRGLAPIA